MRTSVRSVMVLFLAAVLSTSAGCQASREGSGGQGKPAPEFVLEALDGGRVSLADLKGRVVLINLWATWCPPCKEELPVLQAAYEEHRDEGLVVLGIDIGESRSVVEPFVRRMGLTYPVLLDSGGTMMARYRALGLPTSILVDREGIVQARHQGELSQGELNELLEQHLSRGAGGGLLGTVPFGSLLIAFGG